MNRCECGSRAINPHLYGRDNTDLDLCDVCYWRKRAQAPEPSGELTTNTVPVPLGLLEELMDNTRCLLGEYEPTENRLRRHKRWCESLRDELKMAEEIIKEHSHAK